MTAPGPDPRQDLGSWSVTQGDPLSITLTFNVGGTPVDLTTIGTSWAANLRQGSTTMVPAVSFTVDATGAATGTLVLSLTGTQTAGMAIAATDGTRWDFDLQATGGAVTPQTPFKGAVTVWKVYTHA